MYGTMVRWLEPMWLSSRQLLSEQPNGTDTLPQHGSQELWVPCSKQYSGAGTYAAPAKQLDEVKLGPNGRKLVSGGVRRRLVGATTSSPKQPRYLHTSRPSLCMS